MINGNLTKIFVGGAVTVGISIVSFMGYGIVNNDVRNTTGHVEIRREMLISDKEIDRNIDRVKDIVTDVRLEQVEQRGILERIEGKL